MALPPRLTLAAGIGLGPSKASTSVIAHDALQASIRLADRRLIMTCGGFMAWLFRRCLISRFV
jgi:hypothetical protein